VSVLLKARLKRHKSRGMLAQLCGVKPQRILDWEMGYAKVPPLKMPIICTLLRVRESDLNAPATSRECWLCSVNLPLERAHIVPVENTDTDAAERDRPENIADLCRNHHRVFDYIGLDRTQADTFYGVLRFILESCGGSYSDECGGCVYRSPLAGAGAPYCLGASLPAELSKINPERLRGTAATVS
jgi:hypothetical protein